LKGFTTVALDRTQLDVTDVDAVVHAIEAAQPDVVVNAAAYTAVDTAETEPELAMRVNAEGAAHIATAATLLGASVIQISTDYVFDGSATVPYRPDDHVHPIGAYGESKLAGEAAVRAISPQHAIIRTSWVFSHRGRNFVRAMLGRSGDKELRIVGDQRGRPTSAADLADALLAVASAMTEDRALCGTWHFANAGATTWYDFARAIFETSGTGSPQVTAIVTSDYPTRARRPRFSVLDTSSFELQFSLTPRPWHDALRDTLRQIN
jgi:dTDP-4-dehydrorhamnose reductase